MAMTNTTKMANRYGLNLTLTNIKDSSDTATIDFANEVSLEVTGEITWATGGQGHVKMIGFKDPREGTLKISTQVTNMQLLHLISGGKITEGSNTAKFKDDIRESLRYYKIEGDTVWQDEQGTTYEEHIVAYKCLVKPNYSATYNGSGDPISLDVEFELATDSDGNFLDITRSEEGSAKDISKATIAPITQQTFDGTNPVEPTPVVSYDGVTLVANNDYEVSYCDNEAAGTGKLVITGKGDYSGIKAVTFDIVAA